MPTLNEEIHLVRCLESVAGWASQILVVDSFSQDRTREIALRFGAHFVQHRFEGYARQKNWALDNLDIANDWILILDADERLSRELRDEITAMLRSKPTAAGFYLNRRFIFYGKWIRYCGWYPSWNLRLFRHSLGRYEAREVDEHLVLNGRAEYCHHDLIHEDLRGLEAWIDKHNRYSSYETRSLPVAPQGGKERQLKARLFGSQCERKRFIKDRIWPYLPGRSVIFFTYLYFVRLGFLDGERGFVFCLMHAIFEEFKVVKRWELKYQRQCSQDLNGLNSEKESPSTGPGSELRSVG
ncbi:MAG: glycosyltransferase family 2 protein [Acidobacteria bacterium]|nr:glycosyltransferase family 2 protein [Acidobacteriota bacterium]